MATCSICLGQTDGEAAYHAACLETLFGTAELPKLDMETSALYSLAASRMAGKMSISGAQEKISLALSPDGTTLDVAATGGRYILKPETTRFSAVPQNEQLTMRLASLVSIETPPFGLIRLKDGAIAYIIRRFDRLDGGKKLALEDFCQLAEKPLRDKYDGSAELCARILRTCSRSLRIRGMDHPPLRRKRQAETPHVVPATAGSCLVHLAICRTACLRRWAFSTMARRR